MTPYTGEYPGSSELRFINLPPIPLCDRLELSELEPAHFNLTDRQLAASAAVSSAIANLVAEHFPGATPDTQTLLTHRAALAVRDTLSVALNPNPPDEPAGT